MNKFIIKKRRRKIICFLFIFLIILFFLSFKFRPVAKSIARNKAKIIVSEIINNSIMEEINKSPDFYNGIVKSENQGENFTKELHFDALKINMIKSSLASAIQKKFIEFKEKNFWISLGTLSGFEIVNEKGPKVPMKISASGSVFTDFKSDFSTSGINQTIYQMYVNVKCKISVMMPGCSCSEEVNTDVLISQVVIVGTVPRVFAGSGSEICRFSDECKN
ncbi:MAG: sporulation protein YunB [Clostridia bacterium]|nr:sporulation protein YunB [Clostridia bacterium]